MSDTEQDPKVEEVKTDLTDSNVVTKYKMACAIAEKTLAGVISYCKIDQKVVEICKFGDTLVVAQCKQVYKAKKQMEKGLAFPTCVSVNDCVCHYSPLESESVSLKEGDVVKVDIGVHIDGFIAVVAHTLVVQAEKAPVTGKAADVIMAAYTAAEACVKLIKPGVSNSKLTDCVNAVAENFGVNAVQGVLMHQMKQFVIDGNKCVIGREEADQKVEDFEFEQSQVYTVDVVMSTGEGKPLLQKTRTTVFKRAVDQTYSLKMKAARSVFQTIKEKKFTTLPFTLRALGDESKARLGITELVKHEMVHPYPVLYEKQGDLVAHFKYTVLMLSSGTVKVTGQEIDLEQIKSDVVVTDEIKAILALSAKSKKKKRKKKKKPAADAAATPPTPPS